MDWFAAGAQRHDQDATAAPLPPLNDMVAQRHWLAGFGAAWVERRPHAGNLFVMGPSAPARRSVHRDSAGFFGTLKRPQRSWAIYRGFFGSL